MKILFVCMGNICRSPTVEGVFRQKLQEYASLRHVEVDSAGTHAYHVGEPPDPRSIVAATRRGIALNSLRARVISDSDFVRFDWIFAMDRANLEVLQRMSPPEYHPKLRLFLEGVAPDDELPDPYYGAEPGFELVLDLAEAGATQLLDELLAQTAKQR
jgi:protein-tyrosine phosphatase